MGSVEVDFFAAACEWLAEHRGKKAVGPEGGPIQQLITALGEAERAWQALPELPPRYEGPGTSDPSSTDNDPPGQDDEETGTKGG